jgi:hypothetical protein
MFRRHLGTLTTWTLFCLFFAIFFLYWKILAIGEWYPIGPVVASAILSALVSYFFMHGYDDLVKGVLLMIVFFTSSCLVGLLSGIGYTIAVTVAVFAINLFVFALLPQEQNSY